MKRFIKVIALVFFSLLLVVITKTILNKPNNTTQSVSLQKLPTDAIKHMSEAIQMATETPNDLYQYDSTTFFAYRKFIERSYPLVHQKLTRTIIDSFHYIYEWRGTDSTKLPMVLMAHYDVCLLYTSDAADD